MAYGVKYRLEFSDVLGNGKKVEIFKKNYTGDVLPMIGSNNPVEIQWQSPENFYKPIIGSKCTLSLLVTDSVTYDDFYKFDEREYKVVVSYAKSQGEIYADRVEADGGTIETFECIDNSINSFESISEYYQNRVEVDGGEIETLSCVSNNISDNNFYRWGSYWSGFLVVDRYREKMTTPPFGITINAFDGLGTLSNYSGPITYNNNNDPTQNLKNNLTRVAEILNNLDLDFDIYISNDLKKVVFTAINGAVTESTDEFEEFFLYGIGYDEMAPNFGLLTAKQQLEWILQNYNLRIYQSFSRWYIVEATNVFDSFVKNELFNEVQYTGVVPTGIRNRITSKLNYTKKEFIDFRKYDKDGASLGTERFPVLYDNNNELKAINNDLSREYLQPVSQYATEGVYYKTKTSFYNAGFEYGSFGYVIHNLPFASNPPAAEIATDEISSNGRRSMKFIDLVPSGVAQVQTFSFTAPSFNKNIKLNNFTFKVKYYIKLLTSNTATSNSTFNYQLSITNSAGLQCWNAEEKKFQSGAFINVINNDDVNVFISHSTTLSNEGLIINSVDGNQTIVVDIYNTNCNNSDYETTYFDNLEIQQKKTVPDLDDQKFASRLTAQGLKTTQKSIKRKPDLLPMSFRTRENFGVYNGTNLWRGTTDLQNQNLVNDFRDFVRRYNGTFRNLKVQPLSMHNKIWFYWSGLETEPQTAIVDNIKYIVKNAEFIVKSHIPNDDDDEPVEFIVN